MAPQTCQTLKHMSRVMTIHHLQRFRYRGGHIEVEKVAITGERSLLLWQVYKLVLWQFLAFSTCPVMSFVRGSLGFNITESWPASLSCTCMRDMLTLLGWISFWHPRSLHRLQRFQMSGKFGISVRYWIQFTLSLFSGHHSWDIWLVCFLSCSSGVSMPPCWDSLCFISPVRADFPRYTHITFASWCTSLECGWWTSRSSFIITLRGWSPSCRGRARPSSTGAYVIMGWFSS